MNEPPSKAVPLVIAVTGHRDLVDDEIPRLRDTTRSFLLGLMRDQPDRPLRVMSALAEGADQLVAELAVELDIELVATLPMPQDLYRDDFQSQELRERYERLSGAASQVLELPVIRGARREDIAEPGAARDRQYAQLGIFMCAHCHILLALWDGKYLDELGGTGQVVRFHHDDVMPGFSDPVVANQQMLIDDESDLVYHIVCSRAREGGAPAEGLEAMQTWWFTKDASVPRSRELPGQHRLIFQRSAQFSRDMLAHRDIIADHQYPLYDAQSNSELPTDIAGINRLFCAADVLALHFQKKILRTLRTTHVLAFLMGLCFILYADVQMERAFMLAFLGFFGISAVVQQTAKRHEWHRKYLDYRALAEGLRVQFYWAAAGIVGDNDAKFAHDSFLQRQDADLGWIRNIMRVAGTRIDARPFVDQAGLEFVIDEWIGDEKSGQLGYFARSAAARIQRNRVTEVLAIVSLLTSVALVTLFVIGGSSLPEPWVGPLMAVMAALLLVYAIRQGYAYALAERELVKQYEFMFRLFQSAHARLVAAGSADEQRQILRALGCAALDEHSEWIMMHRNRLVDQAELWRMSS